MARQHGATGNGARGRGGGRRQQGEGRHFQQAADQVGPEPAPLTRAPLARGHPRPRYAAGVGPFPLTLCLESLSATWKLVLGSFLLHVHSEVDALLFMPFLYSRVHCCELDYPENTPTDRYAVEYPETLAYGLNVSRVDACDLPKVGVLDPAWSHSAHCNSFAYVRNRAQSVLSVYSPVRFSIDFHCFCNSFMTVLRPFCERLGLF